MLYDALRDLPLRIEELGTETLSRSISPEFTRRTTVVHLRGAGEEGLGEDVTYSPAQHGEQFPQLDQQINELHFVRNWSVENVLNLLYKLILH